MIQEFRFFDHMLDGFARHGLFDLNVKVRGDLRVDSHHTIEDTESYWDRQSLHRHLEIRPELSDTDILYCQWMRFLLLEQLTFQQTVSELPGQILQYRCLEQWIQRWCGKFFLQFPIVLPMNLHLKILDAEDNHHMAEALFKAFGKALDMAVSEEPRIKEVWSTRKPLMA